jgi:hypothetical protein
MHALALDISTSAINKKFPKVKSICDYAGHFKKRYLHITEHSSDCASETYENMHKYI